MFIDPARYLINSRSSGALWSPTIRDISLHWSDEESVLASFYKHYIPTGGGVEAALLVPQRGSRI
jgi:hypothetical protein